MNQFDFSDDVYAEQLDPLLSTFGAESTEFAARKAEMLIEICQEFGPVKHLNFLDIGCGPGKVDSFLWAALDHLTCVDSSAPLLAAAREKNPDIRFVQVEEGDPLPFSESEFDVVFFSCVLHHVPVPEWDDFMKEAYRVVRPGGLVICIEHNPWNPLTQWVVSRCPFDEGVTLLSAPRVERLMSKVGLQPNETFYHVFFPGSLSFFQPLEKLLTWLPLGGQTTVTGRKPSPSDLPIDWEACVAKPATVDYTLVITLFNEVDGVEKVALGILEAFRKSVKSFELLLVDNGCIDGTTEIIQALSQEHPEVSSTRVFPNRGYGWGVLHGLRCAKGEAVGFAAGDGQIRPEDMLATFELFSQGGCEMAKVRRTTRGDGPYRKLMSKVWNTIFSTAIGHSIEDGNGTPKVFSRSLLPELKLESKDWFLDSEIWMKGLADGWQIAELEVDFLPRDEGSSHVRFRTIWEFLANTVRWSWKYRSRIRNRLRS